MSFSAMSYALSLDVPSNAKNVLVVLRSSSSGSSRALSAIVYVAYGAFPEAPFNGSNTRPIASSSAEDAMTSKVVVRAPQRAALASFGLAQLSIVVDPLPGLTAPITCELYVGDNASGNTRASAGNGAVALSRTEQAGVALGFATLALIGVLICAVAGVVLYRRRQQAKQAANTAVSAADSAAAFEQLLGSSDPAALIMQDLRAQASAGHRIVTDAQRAPSASMSTPDSDDGGDGGGVVYQSSKIKAQTGAAAVINAKQVSPPAASGRRPLLHSLQSATSSHQHLAALPAPKMPPRLDRIPLASQRT